MKAKLLTSFCLTLCSFIYAQNSDTILQFDGFPGFRKGNLNFDLMRNFNYNNRNYYYNDNKTYESNSLGIDFNVNYFFTDNIALGLSLRSEWSGENYNSGDDKYRNIMTYLNLTYGKPLSANVGLYGRVGIGYGTEKYIEEPSSGNSSTDKSTKLGYRIEVGLPIQIGSGHTYITPQISYGGINTDFDEGKEKNNKFRVGINFEGYVPSNDITCNSAQMQRNASGRYSPGSNVIGYYSKAGFDFGSYKTTYDNLTGELEDDYSKANLMLDYNHYVVRNVAVGAEFGYKRNVQTSGNSDWEYTNSRLMFMPKVTLNAPVTGSLNNAFLQAGYGFGYQKSVTEGNGNTTTYKDNTSNLSIGLGYNKFFTNGISFTPIVGYEKRTQKDAESTTDNNYKNSGIFVEMGMRAFF